MALQKRDISAVIVAGGRGKRLGEDVPKAFIRLGRRYLFEHSLEVFLRHTALAEIILVVPDETVGKTEKIIRSRKPEKTVVVVNGGVKRWQSVRNGVLSTAETSAWVLVHDAARPFVTKAVIDDLLKKRAAYKCAITATPVDDTIRRFRKDRCTATLDRSKLIRVGTPQLFYRPALIEAFAHAESMRKPLTDEAMLMEKCGITIGFSWGDPLNFKITTPADLRKAEALASVRER